MKKSFIIAFCFALLFLGLIIKAKFFDSNLDEIVMPSVHEVESITVFKDEASKRINSSSEIKIIINEIKNMKPKDKTKNGSVDGRNEYRLCLLKTDADEIYIYLIRKNNKYYVEIANGAVYEISKSNYSTIVELIK